MTLFCSIVTILNQLLLTFTNSALHRVVQHDTAMASADFLHDFFGCRQTNSAFGASVGAKNFSPLQDKLTRFQQVTVDLL
jgi:hypothetical protein